MKGHSWLTTVGQFYNLLSKQHLQGNKDLIKTEATFGKDAIVINY